MLIVYLDCINFFNYIQWYIHTARKSNELGILRKRKFGYFWLRSIPYSEDIATRTDISCKDENNRYQDCSIIWCD
jgi:hypothetical protein